MTRPKIRGRGRGRGYPDRGIDRGRGRGAQGRGRARGRGGPGYVAIYEDDGDFPIDAMHFLPRDGRYTPRGRGGRLTNTDNNSRYQAPIHETAFSRGNGFRHGRGWRGGYISPHSSRPEERTPMHHLEYNVHRGEASLSQLFYKDRPLLKPITFVPSKLPSLFLNEEEIFKPMAEEADEQEASHAPTADRVFEIFHRRNSPESPSDAELPEIDYMELGKILNEIDVLEVEATSKNPTNTRAEKEEDQSTTMTVEEPFTGVYIDTKPSPVQDTQPPVNHILVDRPDTHILGEDVEDDDEIIVYVAPNPRKGINPSSPIQSSSACVAAIPPPAYREPVSGQVQQGTYDPVPTTASPAEPILEQIHSPPISSPALTFAEVSNPIPSGSSRPARRTLRPRRVSKRRVKRHVTFTSFGAIRAEVALREVDPRRDEQRCGDSDIDWGVSTSEESVEDGGMLVDHGVDVSAMEAFVKGMSIAGSAPVTMDDLEDEERSNGESGPESDGSANDEELELADDIVLSEEGDLALGDSRVESGVEGTSDEEEMKKGSFQARLERLRKGSVGRPIKDVLKAELDGELEVDEEDSDIAQIQEFLDDNDDILRAQDRKKRNQLFEAINHGKFEFETVFADSAARRKKNKFIPEELREQWERDRAKKAERRRLRELERSAAALDPFTTKKGGKKKKARKARQAAALASPISLETVVWYMRQFVADIGGARTLPLPPMDRNVRKSVHELAHAFKLNSKSKNNGAARFATLTKTTLSGVNVDEKAIAQILGKSSSYLSHEREKGKGRASRIRPRDGEVVGEAAPKLDGSNIGFQMLSAMGWEEGSRIGAVGGLEAPLVAVIKTTKSGLGANRGSS